MIRRSHFTLYKVCKDNEGWTFLIPNVDSVSYGYLYNNTITSKEDATEDFLEVVGNYIAVGERTAID